METGDDEKKKEVFRELMFDAIRSGFEGIKRFFVGREGALYLLLNEIMGDEQEKAWNYRFSVVQPTDEQRTRLGGDIPKLDFYRVGKYDLITLLNLNVHF